MVEIETVKNCKQIILIVTQNYVLEPKNTISFQNKQKENRYVKFTKWVLYSIYWEQKEVDVAQGPLNSYVLGSLKLEVLLQWYGT